MSYWQKNPPHGLESDLLGVQHQAALRMLEATPAVLVALKAQDKELAQKALSKVQEHYAEHRSGVDKSVKRAMAFAEA